MMDVTYTLYELREQLENVKEMHDYNQAVRAVEADVALQILFGEFEKCKEMSVYHDDENRSKQMQRAQQLKMKIFENEHYLALREAEKRVNRLRQTIAQQLFSVIDCDFEIVGMKKNGGGCRCGS